MNTTAALDYAKSHTFREDANVIGFIVGAQLSVGMCYGHIHSDYTETFGDGEFIKFMPTGTDSRQGYNIIKTDIGSLVIVTEDDSFSPATESGFDVVKRWLH